MWPAIAAPPATGTAFIAVGARAGVTRGAPYRHFMGKDSLLDAVATESWERRDQPYGYQLLFKRLGHGPGERGEGLDRVMRRLCGPEGDVPAAPRPARCRRSSGVMAAGQGEASASVGARWPARMAG
ncbi:helix-turn-helix domain containing protein [Nonomuraea spiralis]|uniref:Helix-turn-helix domain containing protein n=1 Tax=Nonomuraea spiralis TaxID=46182 RepID=A0ABV5IF27_9ACTN|nr:helix-turn-helix domain containing protein [Nonomuraea spiralis]